MVGRVWEWRIQLTAGKKSYWSNGRGGVESGRIATKREPVAGKMLPRVREQVVPEDGDRSGRHVEE